MPTPLRVLLVEDNPRDAELIAEALESAGYAVVVTRVEREADYSAALGAGADIVLCDHALPQFNTVRALTLMQTRGPDIPFIVVSGQIVEEQAVEIVRLGADDYLLKDRMARLAPAVAAALERRRLRLEARRATDELAATRERHLQFLENSPAALFMKDTDGRYLHVNREFTRFFGMNAQAIIGKRDDELFCAGEAALFQANDRAVLAAAQAIRFEETARCVEGLRTSIVVRFPLKDATGRIYGIGGIATDVTERNESEARYRATFNQAAVGIAHCRPGGHFIAANDRLCDIVGYSREELLGRGFQALVHPDDLAMSVALRDELIADPALAHTHPIQCRCISKNGAAVWVTVTISSVCIPSGELDYFVAMVQDITSAKLAEERLRATFEQAAVGIVHTSLDSRYLMVNEKFCEMTGYTQAELLCMHTYHIIHPDEQRQSSLHADLLEGRIETFSAERRYRRKNGSMMWVNRTVSLVRDATGLPLYFLRVIEDVTARKRADTIAALLQATTRAVAEARDLESALRIVLQKICEATGWSFGQAWLPAADGKCLERRLCWHDGSAGLDTFHCDTNVLVFDEAPGPAMSAFRSKTAAWLDDLDDAQFRRRESALAVGLRGWAGIPVLAGDSAVALLEFFVRDREQYAAELVELVSVVAAQLGILFQRKAAEDSSRESDERFRQLALHIPEVFWMTDAAQSEVTYVSPAYEKLTGRSLAELRMRSATWAEAIHPDDRERAEREWKSKVTAGTYDTEYRIMHTDGSVRWVHDRAFPVRGATGEVQRIAGIAEDVTERKRVEERLLRLAHYDQLTDVPNRVLFYDRLKQSLAHARRSARNVAVLMIDVDRFKLVNDTLGHASGDTLLRKVSERLTSCVRPGDTVGRLGGDEFAVILSDLATPQDAGAVARNILNAFAPPFPVEASETPLTVSIGIAVYPSDSTDLDTLVRAADAAMYNAKDAGRNTFRFYTADMNQRAVEKARLERQLREAIAHEEFLLHFQPKVDIVTGEIAGCEALLRWQSPEDGLVPPDRFIPILEETGLITAAGEWVLASACRQIKAWKDAHVKPVPIAINLSARQFQQHDLAALVAETLREHAVSPRYLELEITESAAMQNAEASLDVLRELKGLGVSLAIDDFGTGYSSLSYLKRLPVNTVKIDRAFISGLPSDADDALIAHAIINMAHNLGLKVVAEGVETASQLAFLAAHGCDQMQGYHFSRPVNATEMTAMLRENRRLQRPPEHTHDGTRTLLLVDGEENVLSALKRLLRHDNYRVLTARSAKAAFEILASHRVGVIVSDQRMPEGTGVDFLRAVKELYPASVRMVLSGYTDLASVTEAINQGAIYRFLTKPWDDGLLRAHIAQAFAHYAILQEHEREQQHIRAQLQELTAGTNAPATAAGAETAMVRVDSRRPLA